MDENKVKQSMQGVIDYAIENISSVRTGRANPSMIENLVISAYGGQSKLRLMELASIIAPDPYMLIVEPWDKSQIGDINKGLQEANLGFNPILESEKIRINLPPLTTEDREKFVKLVRSKLEDGRIAIRKERLDSMQDVKKKFEDKEITEDQKFYFEKKIQELTDHYISELEKFAKAKEEDLMKL